MTAKPLTSEAIAFTEKKMDMTLDDIIKMSKNKSSKGKKLRASNKSENFLSGQQNRSLKVRQYMDSRSSLRQGALAKKRTSFQGNRFPLASEAAKKAVVAPFRNRAFNKSRPANWNNRPRPGPPVRQPISSPAAGGMARKAREQQHYQQQQTKPHTLDSLFANMKEQRMRALARPNNVVGHGGVTGAQAGGRQPWGARGHRFRN